MPAASTRGSPEWATFNDVRTTSLEATDGGPDPKDVLDAIARELRSLRWEVLAALLVLMFTLGLLWGRIA